ncbi:MAG: hypothetical protein LIP18_07220 [Planctomycetes bacterium]|nr:hypothetical protein [Planctomycetota bacterium]
MAILRATQVAALSRRSMADPSDGPKRRARTRSSGGEWYWTPISRQYHRAKSSQSPNEDTWTHGARASSPWE